MRPTGFAKNNVALIAKILRCYHSRLDMRNILNILAFENININQLKLLLLALYIDYHYLWRYQF